MIIHFTEKNQMVKVTMPTFSYSVNFFKGETTRHLDDHLYHYGDPNHNHNKSLCPQ